MSKNNCEFIIKRGASRGKKCKKYTKDVFSGGVALCDKHYPICLDNQKYFDYFLEWVGEDELERFSEKKQENMYKDFVNYLSGIYNLSILLEISDITNIEKTRQDLFKHIKSNNADGVSLVRKFCGSVSLTPEEFLLRNSIISDPENPYVLS